MVYAEDDSKYESLRRAGGGMSADERRKKRLEKQLKRQESKGGATKVGSEARSSNDNLADGRFTELLLKNEDELLKFVAKVNKVYQEKLKKPAPFMTFVFCGMQSAGKSTIMERFMSAVLNIVMEGTGTRCPLDTTCIHDESCVDPRCELSGLELNESKKGNNLSMNQVFESITEHNKKLGSEDRFSTEPLYLVYRAQNVQNMRFVDTPGIISNKSTGKDNRQDIKMILNSEMSKPNTKLCVLLEPKEFATNPIIDFCDESFGGRDKWIGNATFLMTKFDKQLEDSRTGDKANNFFNEFHNNKCYPHLVITPTLPKEDLPPDELFKARRKLLDSAERVEKNRFDGWLQEHDLFRQENGGDLLKDDIREKVGFPSAKKVMREIMLEDTAKRLPEVLASLRKELGNCLNEEKTLTEIKKFNDPTELKLVVVKILFAVEERVLSYLDGDLECSIKFPDKLQVLDDEIEEEEESEWARRELNHYTENEVHWRDQISNMDYPDEIQADKLFLGGKQVHRAIEFFKAVMISALPDPYQLRHVVPNGTGYLGGGLQRENWERAMVQITRVCVKDVSHPGINYLIKHVGSIFRRLFTLALEDIKQGEELSAVFKLLPNAVEKYLVHEFDEILWELLKDVADKTHCSLEPMYSTVDPNLPTFYSNKLDGSDEELYVRRSDGVYELKKSSKQNEETFLQSMKSRFNAFVSSSGDVAKDYLKNENTSRARLKKNFLPDERTSMITEEETDKILRRSFEYIVALMEFNLVTLKFQLNHYLYEGFKNTVKISLRTRLVDNADWDTLVEADPSIEHRLAELRDQIKSLSESLHEVQTMQRRM